MLLAEDSEDDIFAMKLACRRTGIPHMLQVVTDGALATDYIAGKGIYSDRHTYPFPDVVFLDVKMPKYDGHQVLEWIRKIPVLRNLPVIMLTGSALPEDVERAYQLGITSYVQKVPDVAIFGQAIRVVLKFWLELNIPFNRNRHYA